MSNVEELQEQLKEMEKSLAAAKREKRAAEREKKTPEDQNKRLVAETEASMDMSGDEQERLLDKLNKKDKELEEQQAGLSHANTSAFPARARSVRCDTNLQLRLYLPLPGSLPAATHLGWLVRYILQRREAKV